MWYFMGTALPSSLFGDKAQVGTNAQGEYCISLQRVYVHRAVGCIRAMFTWRYSGKKAFKWIELYSKQATSTHEEL